MIFLTISTCFSNITSQRFTNMPKSREIQAYKKRCLAQFDRKEYRTLNHPRQHCQGQHLHHDNMPISHCELHCRSTNIYWLTMDITVRSQLLPCEQYQLEDRTGSSYRTMPRQLNFHEFLQVAKRFFQVNWRIMVFSCLFFKKK